MADTVDVNLFSASTKKPEILQEIETINENDFVYKNNFEHKGHAIIFNHYKYDDPRVNKRQGTEKDAAALQKTFSKLGFTVQIHNDLKFLEIESELEKVSKVDHSKNACLVVVVMSHGENRIINARDHEYSTDELWKYFTGKQCPSLAGKPKLFFIQACRGDKVDSGVIIQTDSSENNRPYVIPEMADILVMYSTYEGYYSWRSGINGSWFIQSLCGVLNEEKFKDKDLLTLLTYVNNKIAIDFQSNVPHAKSMHKKKQVGTVVSTLTKVFYITNFMNNDKNA